MSLTPENLDRLEERLERWSGPENPSLPVNYCFELLALARKGLEAERFEREAEWLAARCHEFCDTHDYCEQCPHQAGPYKRERCDCGGKIVNRFEKSTVEDWRENARKAIEGGEIPKPYGETYFAMNERLQRKKPDA